MFRKSMRPQWSIKLASKRVFVSLLSSVVRDLNSTMGSQKLHNLAADKCKVCHLYICPLIIGIDIYYMY